MSENNRQYTEQQLDNLSACWSCIVGDEICDLSLKDVNELAMLELVTITNPPDYWPEASYGFVMTDKGERVVRAYRKQLDRELRDSSRRSYAIQHAVMAECTCGGGGPNDPHTCPACKVYHRLVTPRTNPMNDIVSCEWTQDEWDGNWETGCKERHCFEDGGPTENHHCFCPYCGKPLKVTPNPEKCETQKP